MRNKNVNYKKRLSVPNVGSIEAETGIQHLRRGMLVLTSFVFWCSLKRLANSLVAVLVSEWCGM